MKISKKKILEIIKEEVSDVNISNESGTTSELAYTNLLSKKNPNGSRAALSRLMKLDVKVQYLDQELKKLKNNTMNKVDAAAELMPRLEETGEKDNMKISKKKLQRLIKEELQKTLQEQPSFSARSALRRRKTNKRTVGSTGYPIKQPNRGRLVNRLAQIVRELSQIGASLVDYEEIVSPDTGAGPAVGEGLIGRQVETLASQLGELVNKAPG